MTHATTSSDGEPAEYDRPRLARSRTSTCLARGRGAEWCSVLPDGQVVKDLPGDIIRQTWYLVDGPKDRPQTVADCHGVIECLPTTVGEMTGITNAGVIPEWEQAKYPVE